MGRCYQCERKFDDLNLHLDLAHSNKHEKWCKHCGRLFSKKSHLKKHLNTNQCDGNGHRCYVCKNENFSCVKSFSCHMETHKSLHVYACNDCKRTFMLRDNYNEHVSLVHDNRVVSVDELLKDAINCTFGEEAPAKFLNSIGNDERSDGYCIQCHRCFPQMKIHRALAHHDKPQIICHLCGRQFHKIKYLESHWTEHRLNTIECHVCKKNDFVNLKAFCKHLEEHESLWVLPCNLCPKVFSLKINLDKHVRKKHKDFQPVDDKSECTVSKSNETDRIQESNLPENSLCLIHFVNNTNIKENLSSPKKRNSFTTNISMGEVSGYPSLSCEIVKVEPCYLKEESISVREDKKKHLYSEISSSQIRKRKYSSLSLPKEDEDPNILIERSVKEESFIETKKKKKKHTIENSINQSSDNVISVLGSDTEDSIVQTKKKKKKSDKENTLSLLNQSSDNVLNLFKSDKEESLSIVKKNKKNKSDKENLLSPSKKNSDNVKSLLVSDKEETLIQTKKKNEETLLSTINQSSVNVISLLESDDEESLSLVKKNKKNKSDKEYASGLREKHSSGILSFESDNEESSSLVRKNKKTKNDKESSLILTNEMSVSDKYSRSSKDKNTKLNDSLNLCDNLEKLGKSKKCKEDEEEDSRMSPISDSANEKDCLSDTSQSSLVDKTCFKCGIKFTKQFEVHLHFFNVHNYLSMTCQTCDKKFKTHFSVYCHAMKHSNAYPWKCKQCDVRLKTKKYYRRHMLRVHDRKKMYICPHCDETFIYHLAYVAHVALHSDQAKFNCTHCDKKFRYKKLIKPHQEQIDCNQCDSSFPCKTLFKEHLLDKHPYDSLFTCPHCDNRYNLRNVLRRHITNKHFNLLNKDPVYCQLCDYYTHSKYNLNRHVKIKHAV